MALLSTVSLLLMAAALVLSILWLVNAPAAGAASDVIRVEPLELSVSEPAGQSVFTITLVSAPTDTVTIALSTSDTTECVVDPPSLVFTPESYEAVVTIAAQNDDIDDGDQLCTVETAQAMSNDLTYSGEDADDVFVTVTDDDTAGIIIAPTSLIVAEPDGRAAFTVTLTSQPTDTVSIGITAEDPQCDVAPDKLILTSENWQTGLAATVTAVDDDDIDGPQSCRVAIGRTQSDDSNYDHLLPSPVEVIVTDDDGAQDASIGDYVWFDENGDGIQDDTESGLPDAVVYLDLTGDGSLDAGEPFTTTDENGSYAITDLGAGSYSVRVNADTVPTGYSLTTGNVPLTVSLAESEHYDQADFGYDGDLENASIGDYVWVDQDGDGVQDFTEMGLSDVVVFLDLDDSGTLDEGESSSTTDANGNYAIAGLAAGFYTVTVDAGTVPAGYVLSTGNVPLTVDLTESEYYDQADFGYDDNPEDASIGDYVWFDENGDGVQDEAEPGLSGITVYLDLDNSGTLDGGEPTATADEGGNYAIAGLATGFYTVTVDADTVPAGYVLTTDPLPLIIDLAAGETYIDADFGYEGYRLALELIGEGSVTVTPGQASYMPDSTVILSPTATAGWGFDSWGGPDAPSLSENGDGTWSLLMDGDKELIATFTEDEYHLTVNVEGMGSVAVDPEWTIYRYGDEVTLAAAPDPDWRFDGWSGDLGGTTNPAVLEMDGDKTVTAVFELQSSTFYVYLPLVLNNWPPVPSVPLMDSIDNADGDGNYTVSWSTPSDAETYVLQESTNSAFVDTADIYSGSSTSYDLSGRGAARYYYRVKAQNTWGESDWSNVRQADVVWEAEPNDAYTQANGAIVPTLVYYGTLPSAADIQDYYFFELSVARPIEIWLTNIPIGQDYDLVLRDKNLSVVGYAPQGGNSNEHVEADLSPGRYYIQVYHRSTGGSTQPYHLRFVLE